MRKLFIILPILLISINIFAKLSISTTNGGSTSHFYEVNSSTAVDTVNYVILYNGISNLSQINFIGSGTNINWYKYSDLANPIATNQTSISPDDSTGYVLNVDGVKSTIWVIDYSKKYPKINSLIASSGTDRCKNTNVTINGNLPDINYYGAKNSKFTINRTYTVTNKNGKWGGTAWDFTQDTTQTVKLNSATKTFTIPAPIYNSPTMNISISGDQFNTDLNIPQLNVTGVYAPWATACHITTETNARTEKNESKRPDAKTLDGSAPLDVKFTSNANDPITKFYSWKIFKDGQLILTRTDSEHRFSFTEAGKYKVTLMVRNDSCSASDSTTVNVVESALYIPRVFTPNGDGINDEFRVGYKSIVSFECWVYSRWGRLVYHGNDPQRGWDGTINGGNPAAPGAYFYVIKAVGSEGKQYKMQGDINLLR